MNQLPGFGVVVGGAPCGHAGPADAVVNDVVELTVGELLGFGLTHVRGPRIEVAPISVSPLPSLAWQEAQWSAKWRMAAWSTSGVSASGFF